MKKFLALTVLGAFSTFMFASPAQDDKKPKDDTEKAPKKKGKKKKATT